MKRKTTTGTVDSEILAFTVGKDPETDLVLASADCIGTAAHVTMLSRLPGKYRVYTATERKRILKELARIMKEIRQGKFKITANDQDVHMAVERLLTQRLGKLGKNIHTGRSRNDQVAVDLRLYSREKLLESIEEAATLVAALLTLAANHRGVPMAGRTHFQPAMPSSVDLWASAYAESLLDDITLIMAAYDLNDRSPLGAAAGYGVPIPLDRELTASLLGFSAPIHNVLHAINARGKCESIILFAMGQLMLTLSRLGTDLILFSAPEFRYFTLPSEYCTGSSIMPQKRNPDVLELIRAKAATVMSRSFAVAEIVRGLPGGYNRDLQETKAPFVEGIEDTLASVRITTRVVAKLKVNRDSLQKGLSPELLAADKALKLSMRGVPFRDAYNTVKKELAAAEKTVAGAIAERTHTGAGSGLDLQQLLFRAKTAADYAATERAHVAKATKRLFAD